MNYRHLILWHAFMVCLFVSCHKSSTVSTKQESYILTIDGNQIPTSEFKYAYEKNRKKDSTFYQEQSIREYLELFTNFKLKVKDAAFLQMDTGQTFIKELESYKKQLARPYMSDEAYIEELVKEAFNRNQEEIKASHILLKIAEDAIPADTLAVYQKISAIRDSILNNTIDFEAAALKYSQDPSVKVNKGDLGYFSALRMVYSFETACYNTPTGQVSDIVRTSYGYHILKVFDRRKAKGMITTRHIMTSQKNKQANQKINEAYAKLLTGADWDSVCKEYSEHGATKQNGGLLKPFSTGGIGSQAFEDAAYALAQEGDFSKPIKTQFGYHIIKLVKKDPLQTFEQAKEELTTKIKKNERSQLAKQKLAQKLIAQNGCTESGIHQQQATITEIDSILHGKHWIVETHSTLRDKELFVIGDSSYTLHSFYRFILTKKNSFKQKKAAFAIEQLYNQFKNDQLIAYEMSQLPKKHPEYRRIVKEYKEGIMLFDLMNQKVWKKATDDTSALKSYYQEHIQNYNYKQRAKTLVYASKDKQSIEKIKQLHTSGKTKEQIDLWLDENKTLSISVEEYVYEQGHSKTPPAFVFEKRPQLIKEQQQYLYILVEELLPPSTKEFKKVKGIVISDYQKQLEKEWVQALRSKYHVLINEASVQQLIKK